MGFVITATNIRGTVSTFLVPAKKIAAAYASFDHQWSLESRQYARRPVWVQYHIDERL